MKEGKNTKGTPLMQQNYQVKATYPDTVLLIRVGDFCEAYSEDAVTASRVLGLVQTKKSNGAIAVTDISELFTNWNSVLGFGQAGVVIMATRSHLLLPGTLFSCPPRVVATARASTMSVPAATTGLRCAAARETRTTAFSTHTVR